MVGTLMFLSLLIIVKVQNEKQEDPRKYKKNILTGNSYYAAKAGKEMKKKNIYYQGMGAKGGRPRIYNGV